MRHFWLRPRVPSALGPDDSGSSSHDLFDDFAHSAFLNELLLDGMLDLSSSGFADKSIISVDFDLEVGLLSLLCLAHSQGYQHGLSLVQLREELLRTFVSQFGDSTVLSDSTFHAAVSHILLIHHDEAPIVCNSLDAFHIMLTSDGVHRFFIN